MDIKHCSRKKEEWANLYLHRLLQPQRGISKDEFPLPLTKIMVNATAGHVALSFMDGFSGYNQNRMAPKDKDLTAFRTPKRNILL